MVELVPEANDKEFFKVRVVVSPEGSTLKQFVIFFKDGQRYTLSLSHFEFLHAMRDTLFTFYPEEHKGVELIDLR